MSSKNWSDGQGLVTPSRAPLLTKVEGLEGAALSGDEDVVAEFDLKGISHSLCLQHRPTIERHMHIISHNCSKALYLNRWVSLGWMLTCYDGSLIEPLSALYPNYASLFPDLLPIQRSDLLRYAVVFKDGGGYADDDVEPYPHFQTNFDRYQNSNLIVGYERFAANTTQKYCVPEGRPSNSLERMLCRSIGQWQFFAKHGCPLLGSLIDYQLRALNSTRAWEARVSFNRSNPDLVYNHVINSTGPSMFTDYIQHAEHVARPLHQIDVGNSFAQTVFELHKRLQDDHPCKGNLTVLPLVSFACQPLLKGVVPTGAPVCTRNNTAIWSQHYFQHSW